MEKEISNGAMLGIVLIALAAIIGLGFGVFAIAKGTANEGVTGVQENLGAVGNSAFTDYDQKIVTGTQVSSCLQNFAGKPYAILIATQSVKDNTDATEDIDTTAAGLEKYGTPPVVPMVGAYAEKAMTNEMDVPKSTTGTAELTYINYNSLLNHNGAGTPSYRIGYDQNCWRAVNGFKTTSGKVDMNGVTGNISKSGMIEYIPSSARFQSYLVKDLSGTIMGIAFEQLSNQ